MQSAQQLKRHWTIVTICTDIVTGRMVESSVICVASHVTYVVIQSVDHVVEARRDWHLGAWQVVVAMETVVAMTTMTRRRQVGGVIAADTHECWRHVFVLVHLIRSTVPTSVM